MAKAITRDQFVALWEAGVRCVSASGVDQEHANEYVAKGEDWYASEKDFNTVVNRGCGSDGWFFAVATE